jgi:hypothetical protein
VVVARWALLVWLVARQRVWLVVRARGGGGERGGRLWLGLVCERALSFLRSDFIGSQVQVQGRRMDKIVDRSTHVRAICDSSLHVGLRLGTARRNPYGAGHWHVLPFATARHGRVVLVPMYAPPVFSEARPFFFLAIRGRNNLYMHESYGIFFDISNIT